MMTVTSRKGIEALLMENDFATSGSASGHGNEDSSDEESEELDSDVEGAIYAQLYFQDGTTSEEQKSHIASPSGGINVTVVPLAGGEPGMTLRARGKSRQLKQSSGYPTKISRLYPPADIAGEEPASVLPPRGDALPPPHPLDEVDSRSLAVLKKSLRTKTSAPTGELAAEGLCEWVEARWSGDSSSEGDDELPSEGQSGCVAIATCRKQRASGQSSTVGPGMITEPEDCVIVDVEPADGHLGSRKRKASPEGPGSRRHVLSADNKLLALAPGKEGEGDPTNGPPPVAAKHAGVVGTNCESRSGGDSSIDEDSGKTTTHQGSVTEVTQRDSNPRPRHKKRKTCPDDSSSPNDIWYINQKDKMGRAAYDKRNGTGRYFYGTKICDNCRQKDHETNECAQPKRYKVCYLCSGLHHLSSRCPNDLCQYCLEPRHRGKSCRAPWSRPTTNCNRCYMNGHIPAVCPEIWRQCHNTTSYGPLVTIKSKEQRQEKVFCYNCGAEGHFGHECCLRKPQGYALPFTPIIAHYDKNPPVGRMMVTEERDGPAPSEVVPAEEERGKEVCVTEKKDTVLDTPKPKKKRRQKKKEKEQQKKIEKQQQEQKKKGKQQQQEQKAANRKVRFSRKGLLKKHEVNPRWVSPPPRSRPSNADDSEPPLCVLAADPRPSSSSSSRRLSLPASTPETSRPQWGRYSTPVENRRYATPSKGGWPQQDQRRQSAMDGDCFPRSPFLPLRKSMSSGGEESYHVDTPCTEWTSQPLPHSTTPGPTHSYPQYSASSLSFLHQQRGRDATSAGPSSAPRGGSFNLVSGQCGSMFRKITILKPDLQGRRRSHQ